MSPTTAPIIPARAAAAAPPATPCITPAAPSSAEADLLTPEEAAALTGRHVFSLRRYRKEGRLRGFRVLGRVRYRRDDLLALIQPVAL
ncbi:MAG: Helix-turn-helix domain [Verrucomicrobiaceae bacterium]|nr:Helix-turn-helix domain [Verrucomicrobiaceae bacterium]